MHCDQRMNQTIRSKLRMAVQAEQGDIRRSNARDVREREGWNGTSAPVGSAQHVVVAQFSGRQCISGHQKCISEEQ